MFRLRAVTLGLLGAVLVVGILALSFEIYARSTLARDADNQKSILKHLDSDELSNACEAVWKNRASWGPIVNGAGEIDPVNPKLPQAIRALNPHWVSTYQSGLTIELGGQWSHFGFEVYLDDPKSDSSRMNWKDVYHSKQLSKRLWFYSENWNPN